MYAYVVLLSRISLAVLIFLVFCFLPPLCGFFIHNFIPMTSPNSLSTTSIPLAYPGITVESIPWTQNIYEIVWNCGSISVLMTTLSDPRIWRKSFTLLASMLEEVKKLHHSVIFITDTNIFQENPMIEMLFREIFWREKYRFIFTEKQNPIQNTISWLRVNRSKIPDADHAVRVLWDFSDAPVISSIPYSDPRIDELLDLYASRWGNQNTLAIQSLNLLKLNSKKWNQKDIAWEAMGFITQVDTQERLREILFAHKDTPLVLKEDEGAAGGTTVNFLSWDREHGKAQREKVIAEIENFPIVVYNFLHPTILTDTRWQKFPIQMRPYFTLSGRFAGGCIKLPQKPMRNDSGFIEWSGKRAFKDQNETLNTSSGLTQSFFFDEDGNWITGCRVMWEILSSDEVCEIFREFSVNGAVISPELLTSWAMNTRPIVRDIQQKTCARLWILTQ